MPNAFSQGTIPSAKADPTNHCEIERFRSFCFWFNFFIMPAIQALLRSIDRRKPSIDASPRWSAYRLSHRTRVHRNLQLHLAVQNWAKSLTIHRDASASRAGA